MSAENKPRIVNLPGRRLRDAASTLLNLHPLHSSRLAPSTITPTPTYSIKAICISDTHNTQPDLPPGDILIHAGDLSEHGSFDEIQTQLTWLSSQPHRHKIVVAGNHDVLLDEEFLERYPERRYGEIKTLRDLEWGDLMYLQDSSVALELEEPIHDDGRDSGGDHDQRNRSLTIYGTPWTPQYGVSAFQYPRDQQNFWENRLPSEADIVITHGPPRLHLDTRGFHRAGCPFLAQEIARVRPRLVVFGHIHVSYGREDVVLDTVRREYEEIHNLWAGWRTLGMMAARVSEAKIWCLFGGREGMEREKMVTTFVNAAVVGEGNVLKNEAVAVEL